MEISEDILNTGRNVTEDQLYSAIDTVEELERNQNPERNQKPEKNDLCRNNNAN